MGSGTIAPWKKINDPLIQLPVLVFKTEMFTSS